MTNDLSHYPFYRFRNLSAAAGLNHAITTRRRLTTPLPACSRNGGRDDFDTRKEGKSDNELGAVKRDDVADEEFIDFNLGYRAHNYPPRQTAANWRYLAAALEIEPERIVAAKQVHGRVVVPVSSADGGAGIRLQAWGDESRWRDDEGPAKPPVAEADGLCTTELHVWLMNVYADCTPLLFYDAHNRAVAVAHAGWRGTVAQIGAEVVRVMGIEYGTRPTDLLVGIGPAAGPCCYQVGEEVISAVQAAFPRNPELLNYHDQPSSHAILDLWAANRAVLEAAGVPSVNIETASICTITRHDMFFSARADSAAHGGRRFAAIIGLE